MSKNSAKQRLEQLKEWLQARGATKAKKEGKPTFSKSDHYNKVNKHYGSKKNY